VTAINSASSFMARLRPCLRRVSAVRSIGAGGAAIPDMRCGVRICRVRGRSLE